MKNKTRQKKIFERVVNPLLLKHLTPVGSCIASNIPIKYLNYFKEVSAQKNAKKIRYRYRGNSTQFYKRPQSFCHMNMATTFAVYHR
jgi:hypothetical protein